MPYGITQCYLPTGRGDIPAFIPAEAGTRFSDPWGMQDWVDVVGVCVSWWYTRPKTVTHPSTNRARRRVTSFMRRTTLATTPRRQMGSRLQTWIRNVEGEGSRPVTCPDVPGGRYTQNYSVGGSTATVRMPTVCTRSGCTSTLPGEYDWTVRVRRRCGRMSDYFDHLLLGPPPICISRPRCMSQTGATWNWANNGAVFVSFIDTIFFRTENKIILKF